VYAAYYHSPELPWSVSEEEQQRFRRILKRSLIVFLLFGLAMPFLPVPKVVREQVVELPPRLAKLLLERQAPPPPPPKAAEPESPKPAEPKKAEPKKPEPRKTPEKDLAAARAKAERSGLLAFRDELADLRATVAPDKLETKTALAKGPVPGPGPGGPGKGAERALITSNATRGSGGINTASLSRDTGGGGLGGSAGNTRVGSPVGGGGGGGGSVSRGGGGKASRSLEDIKLVFDRNKGSIYTIYNRALREDPTLQGKVLLKLTIAPSGQVTDCQIVSSELKAPELERKLLARIRQWDFGGKDVEVMVVTWPVDFLPS
jgi:TonB family protein